MRRSWLKTALLAGLIAVMLAFAPIVTNSARAGLVRFAMSALPTLLPFLIAAKLLVASGADEIAGLPLHPIARWLRLPDRAAGVLFASLVSGYPAGARLTADLAAEGHIDERQAQTLAAAASHPGPMFVMGYVATALGSAWRGVGILLACGAASVLAARIVARTSATATLTRRENRKSTQPPPSLLDLLPSVIQESCLAMLPVCGSMVFFSVLVDLIRLAEVTRYLGSLAPLLNGFFEMVAGCESALAQGRWAGALCAVILGWGGMSVIAQSLVFLRSAGVGARSFMLCKAVQSLLAGGMVFAFELLSRPAAVQAWVGPPASAPDLWWFPLVWLALCCAFCWAASKVLYRCSRFRKS